MAQRVPATLVWIEAGDGGDPKVKAAVRDRVMELSAPFEGKGGDAAGIADAVSGR